MPSLAVAIQNFREAQIDLRKAQDAFLFIAIDGRPENKEHYAALANSVTRLVSEIEELILLATITKEERNESRENPSS